MLDSESRAGQYGFYTVPGIPHRVGHLMLALRKIQLQFHRENNIINMLAKEKRKVVPHIKKKPHENRKDYKFNSKVSNINCDSLAPH